MGKPRISKARGSPQAAPPWVWRTEPLCLPAPGPSPPLCTQQSAGSPWCCQPGDPHHHCLDRSLGAWPAQDTWAVSGPVPMGRDKQRRETPLIPAAVAAVPGSRSFYRDHALKTQRGRDSLSGKPRTDQRRTKPVGPLAAPWGTQASRHLFHPTRHCVCIWAQPSLIYLTARTSAHLPALSYVSRV